MRLFTTWIWNISMILGVTDGFCTSSFSLSFVFLLFLSVLSFFHFRTDTFSFSFLLLFFLSVLYWYLLFQFCTFTFSFSSVLVLCAWKWRTTAGLVAGRSASSQCQENSLWNRRKSSVTLPAVSPCVVHLINLCVLHHENVCFTS